MMHSVLYNLLHDCLDKPCILSPKAVRGLFVDAREKRVIWSKPSGVHLLFEPVLTAFLYYILYTVYSHAYFCSI